MVVHLSCHVIEQRTRSERWKRRYAARPALEGLWREHSLTYRATVPSKPSGDKELNLVLEGHGSAH